MAIITKPGIYSGITNEIYHGAGLTPTFALSSSGAREIEQSCLKKFWHGSAMNPDRPVKESAVFDIGTATHMLVLEPHDFDRKIEVVYAENWRSKDAQLQRDTARAAGLIPLLVKDRQNIIAMRQAFRSDPVCRALDFSDGRIEATMAWTDPETGVWLRCRPDFLPNHSRYWADLKTAASADPDEFSRAMHRHGYHCQAAWGLDAHRAIFGETVDRYFFLVMEKDPPYLTSVIDVDQEAIDYGRMQNRRAIRRFAEAMERNDWPSYRDRADPWTPKAFKTGLPRHALADLEAQMKAGAFAAAA